MDQEYFAMANKKEVKNDVIMYQEPGAGSKGRPQVKAAIISASK